LAIVGASVHTAGPQKTLVATVLVRDGKIESVGSRAAPAGYAVIDGRGKHVTPGFVDPHSHIAIASRPYIPANMDWNEWADPITPQMRAIDSINPQDPALAEALAAGVTTVNVVTGSDNIISGQTAYIKLVGRTVAEMVLNPFGGLKMANGDSPKRYYGARNMAPSSRMSISAMAREAFLRAREYLAAWSAYERARAAGEGGLEEPARDLALEALASVLKREHPVHWHTGRLDDIWSAIRLSEEFSFRFVCHHCTEGYKIAGELARRNIPAVVFAGFGGGEEADELDVAAMAPVLLIRAGVKVALHTDHPITEQRSLLYAAALAHKFGLSEEDALKTITINPAEMLDLDTRLGSIEPGKDADLVVLDGPPFDLQTHVLLTLVDGGIVFDREKQRSDSFLVRHGSAPRRP
jgi:imidazolonepropionase-like amidohydrolase